MVPTPKEGWCKLPNGDLYGMTGAGGAGSSSYFCLGGCGTVFKINAGGVLTMLHSFDGTDGYEPTGSLVQATDGNLYGTTELVGVHGFGTVFKITLGGGFTMLHIFDGTDGFKPAALFKPTAETSTERPRDSAGATTAQSSELPQGAR
jgi:uncharacterized repeat protein (TIGR03803 family)